jgi:dTDP-4-amino-4,6-dideoxygalactose transaminase
MPEQLAIRGGVPAKKRPAPPMYPGGMAMGAEEEEAVVALLRKKRLFRHYGPDGGPSQVDAFERALGEHLGAPHVRAVSSGTAALVCALAALGIGPGDEVIVPAYAWISTPTAALLVGAVPVVADVDHSLSLDPKAVEAKITPRTRAIIPVHMRGVPADMDALVEVARRRGIRVVEDVAQACGARLRGRALGTYGDIAAFSFQYNKILTTGEGGAVVTSNPELHDRASCYADPAYAGGIGRGAAANAASFFGHNFRTSELVGALGLVQLSRLDGLLATMRRHKATLRRGLEGLTGISFRGNPDPEGEAATSLDLVLPTAAKAQEFALYLTAENVPALVLYAPKRRDLHVYAHWRTILEQRSPNATGFPWTAPYHPASPKLEVESCRATLESLGRTVAVDVNPLYDDTDLEEIVAAIRKVASAVLGGAA